MECPNFHFPLLFYKPTYVIVRCTGVDDVSICFNTNKCGFAIQKIIQERENDCLIIVILFLIMIMSITSIIVIKH